MRLIDADDLEKDLLNKSFYPTLVAASIARAPTINPYEWIGVKDRLPDDIGYFLVWNNKKCQIEIKFFYRLPPNLPLDTYVGVREYFGNVSDYKDITHWTYLPMSPIAKEN